MMRLWVNSYAKPALTLAAISVALSVVVHTGVIAAWVYATIPDADVPSTSMEDHAYYIPPPDKVRGATGPVREVVHYIDLSQQGPGFGDGARTMGNLAPRTGDETIGHPTADTAVAAPAAPAPVQSTQDSVFTVLDVDTAVVRSSTSAAPAYPLKLLEAHIMGYVAARYVVDTTGFADLASFTVLRATNPEFVTAVRAALPYMRFKPAKIGPVKVRQLVEQQFSFRIDTTLTAVADPKKHKPEPGPRPNG